ncbi:MAG TPA: hypothetical protein VNL98_06770 [Gemmatimonadales bacterium]|nr:hypothetical protein [Gemmatimonadales bacterium]
MRWLHLVIDVMGALWLLGLVIGVLMSVAVTLLRRRRQAAVGRRAVLLGWRVLVPPREVPVPPWLLSEPEFELWREAREAQPTDD